MSVTSETRSRTHSTSIASKLHTRALEHMPLGVADNYRFWGKDATVFVATTAGAEITDVDGNSYIDFRLAYGPIILGYRDRRVDAAVINCIRDVGTMTGFSSPLDSEVVELIKALCPNINKLRFANSGTEAVMGAIRCARSFTGRNMIVVAEGGFHGLCDEMMWKADVESWDSSKDAAPSKRPFGSGIATGSGDHVALVSLNDQQALQALFASRGDQIAAVIIEPIMGNCGSIAATPEYMRLLKSLCEMNGSLLIFDEVKTGFRVAKGGVQELLNIRADLTTYAKALGNGYPIAAFGGRSDVMDVISTAVDGVVHGGTYTANMIGLSAAKATLSILRETDALQTVAQTGKRVMGVLAEAFDRFNLPYAFAGHSSMFGIHFMEEEPANYRDWKKSDSSLYRKFAKNMIAAGVMLEPDSREPWFICEAHATMDFNWLSAVTHESLEVALRRE
jgi:glutamate-1-semialdehyde 2,1-aminomutase